MGKTRIYLLFFVLIFILCGCQKTPVNPATSDTETETPTAEPTENSDHLSNIDSDNIFFNWFETVHDHQEIQDLLSQNPNMDDFLTALGITDVKTFKAVPYTVIETTKGIFWIYFPNDGAETALYQIEFSSSENHETVKNLTVGMALSDVLSADPDGDFPFLYVSQSGCPQFSMHFFEDGSAYWFEYRDSIICNIVQFSLKPSKVSDFIHNAFSPTPVDEETTILYGTVYPLIYGGEIDYRLVNSAINTIIDNIITQIRENADEISQFSTDYKIKLQTEEYVSIVYEVYYNVEGSAHPVDMSIGINLDINGNTMQLQDFLTIDSQLVADFKAAWEAQTMAQLQDYLDTYNDDALLNSLGQIDSPTFNVSFYMTEESIVILFPVPRAAGSYASVALPRT